MSEFSSNGSTVTGSYEGSYSSCSSLYLDSDCSEESIRIERPVLDIIADKRTYSRFSIPFDEAGTEYSYGYEDEEGAEYPDEEEGDVPSLVCIKNGGMSAESVSETMQATSNFCDDWPRNKFFSSSATTTESKKSWFERFDSGHQNANVAGSDRLMESNIPNSSCQGSKQSTGSEPNTISSGTTNTGNNQISNVYDCRGEAAQVLDEQVIPAPSSNHYKPKPKLDQNQEAVEVSEAIPVSVEDSGSVFNEDVELDIERGKLSSQTERNPTPLTAEDSEHVEVDLDGFCDEYENILSDQDRKKKSRSFDRSMKKFLSKSRRRDGLPRDGIERVVVGDRAQMVVSEGKNYSEEEVEIMDISYEDRDYTWFRTKKRRFCAIMVFCLLTVLVAVLTAAISVLYFTEHLSSRNNESIVNSQGPVDQLDQEIPIVGGTSEDQQVEQDILSLLTLSPSRLPTMFPSASPTVTKTISPTDSPTISPTVPPTQLPSEAPSQSPTGCTDEIATDFLCYNRNDDVDIQVDFQQCDPNDDDWIGIYPAGANGLFQDDNYFGWSWACGDEDCQGPTFANRVALDSDLDAAWYQVFLLRENSFGEYRIVASSAVFLISDELCV